jgi:SpoU rRNA methylase family enzyme
LEEKWTLGAVSTRTIGGAPTEGVKVVEVIAACESGPEVLVITDVDESTEARAGGGS